jgi:hypothetical protein
MQPAAALQHNISKHAALPPCAPGVLRQVRPSSTPRHPRASPCRCTSHTLSQVP